MKHLVDRLIELLFGTLPGCPLSEDDNEEHDADEAELLRVIDVWPVGDATSEGE